MAELDVQPKKKSPILWIILAVIGLILLFLLFRGCNNSDGSGDGVDTTAAVATAVVDWHSVDFSPAYSKI